jgi:hypothetical protein
MERIRDSGEIVDATNVLTWIYLSGRPLTVNELLHALAVEQGEEDIDEENVDNREIFLDCCLGLATIDTENSTVRLFHSRLHEYFEERGQVFEQTFKQGHDYIARTCLTYIMFRPLTLNLLPQKGTDSPASDAKTISDYHLLDYASCQWGRHLEKSGQAENMVVELAKRYLSMDPRKRYWSQWYLCSHIIQGSRFESFVASFSKLHIAAYFGIDSVLSDTLLAAAELNSRDAAFGQTPLSWAAKGGHLAVVKLLVKAAGVEVDSNDWYNQTPLSWAAGNGHESVVELLLETANVEVDSKSIYHRTPLSWAAENAHVKIVELLLKTGKVDVNYESSWGGTPLSWATRAKREGYEAVVELLLKTENVDVGYRDEHSQTTQRQSTSTTEIVSDSYSFTLTDDSAREHGFNATGWETLRTNDRWEVMAKGSRLTINGSGAAGAILYTHANGERFVVVLGIHNYDIWSAIESKFDNDTLEEVITSYYPSARPKVTRTDSGSDRVTKSLSDGKVAKLQIKDDNGSRRNYLVWISVTQ